MLKLMGIFKTENKVDKYVLEEADSRALKIIDKDVLTQLVDTDEVESVINDKGTLRVKLGMKEKLALNILKMKVQNNLTVDEYINKYGLSYKTSHFAGISHNFVIGTIVAILDTKLGGSTEHMVSAHFLGNQNVIESFEKHVKRVNKYYTQVINYGEHCDVICPLAEFLSLAKTKGVIVNPNSAKSQSLSPFIGVLENIQGCTSCNDEVKTKVYNKLAQIEKNILG